jgi:hypothetical protein
LVAVVHALPITRQARALNVSQGSVYYRPRPASASDLALMRRIDELHLDFPFAGSRMLRDPLTAEGFQTGRRHGATLMKRMAIQAVYRKPNTSKSAPRHKIYPYLLRDLPITRPNRSGPWGLQATRSGKSPTLADHYGAARGLHGVLFPMVRQAGLRRRVQTKRERIRTTAALKANAEW